MNLRLLNWMVTQRRNYKLYKANLSSTMTQERIDALEAIGFTWTVDKASANRESPRHLLWHSRLEELRTFKEEHGEFPSTPTNSSLWNWIGTQRRNYKLYKANLTSPMTQERIDALEVIGFRWTADKNNAKMGKLATIGRDKEDKCSGKRKSSSDIIEESSTPGGNCTRDKKLSKKKKKQKRKPKLIPRHLQYS